MAKLIFVTGKLNIRHRALVFHGSLSSVYDTKEGVLTLQCYSLKFFIYHFKLCHLIQNIFSSHKSIFWENTCAYIDATCIALMSHLHSSVLCFFFFCPAINYPTTLPVPPYWKCNSVTLFWWPPWSIFCGMEISRVGDRAFHISCLVSTENHFTFVPHFPFSVMI